MVPEGAAAEDPHPAPVGAGGAAPRRPGPHRALTATQAGAAIPPVWGVRARTGFSTFSFLAEPQKEAATLRPAPMFALAFGLLLAPGSAIAITLPDCPALAAWTDGHTLRDYQGHNPRSEGHLYGERIV